MSDHGFEQPIEWVNPMLPSFWVRPLPEIEADVARLRAQEPLAWRPPPELPEDSLIKMGPCWVVTRYADIMTVSKQPDIFSSAQGITLLEAPPSFNEFFGSMIAMDDPRHARLRKLVSSGFTPRMLRRVEDSVSRIAAELVEGVAERGEVDFVVDVAAALPLRVICEMMGIPPSQFDFVFERTNVILGAGDPEYVDGIDNILGAVLQAGADLSQLMEELATSKLASAGGEDLTSMLVRAEVDGERLTHAELASFFILLVVAGNETTRNAISWGLHYLTENPDQRRAWQNNFEPLAHSAVDEIVRMASPVTYMRRTATRDVELRGQRIAEGDRLALLYWSANRDEDVFAEPLRFNVARQPNDHVGFGGPGPHFCLGAHLARREITVMFRELFRRLPDITASGPPDPLLSAFIHGVKHLPARFTPS